MKLYFLRHGLADRDQWSGDDFERPLTEEGKQRMQQQAEVIAGLDLGLEAILTSPLRRALQTAQIVADCLIDQGQFRKEALVVDKRLACGFSIEDLRQIVQDYATARALMLVGHEPDFSRVIGQLIGGGRVVCKKGGLARIDLFDQAGMAGELVWLLPPKFLGG